MTTKAEILRLIRENCGECMGMTENDPSYLVADVENCTAPNCKFYDFRFGKDPYPNKRRSDIAKIVNEINSRDTNSKRGSKKNAKA